MSQLNEMKLAGWHPSHRLMTRVERLLHELYVSFPHEAFGDRTSTPAVP